MPLSGYGASSLNRLGRQIVLAVAGANGVASSTISANPTFDNTSAMVSLVNGGAANRNLTADASCEVVGMVKVFKNTGSTNNLVLQNSAASTIATLLPGDWAVIVHNGTTWVSLFSTSYASALAAILATANTWTALQTFSSGYAGKANSASLFVSTEQTGNGSAQSIAHGLSAAPTRVIVATTAVSGNFTIVEGTHTSTNVVVTVTNGIKYKVWAQL